VQTIAGRSNDAQAARLSSSARRSPQLVAPLGPQLACTNTCARLRLVRALGSAGTRWGGAGGGLPPGKPLAMSPSLSPTAGRVKAMKSLLPLQHGHFCFRVKAETLRRQLRPGRQKCDRRAIGTLGDRRQLAPAFGPRGAGSAMSPGVPGSANLACFRAFRDF
jgi:hypothetical protein